jgi:serine/threonine protein kinase
VTLPAARRALLTPGVRVGDVVVTAELGAGSSATVYRARPVPDAGGQDAGGDDVALKVRALAGEPAEDLVDRFRREFELARLVAGPHVVPVYDHGLDRPGGGRTVLWLTMELVDGGTGTGLVPAASAEPDLDRVLPVLGQVAGALDRAHALDVLHRDVKPANVLLRPGPLLDAVLTDFGTAQLLADLRPAAPRGRVAGSLPYAAPELLTGGRLGPATDVYALACTAVEWLTGAPPFPRATAFAVTSAHLTDPPPDLVRRRGWLPAAAGEALARGLAKEPGDRFGSCGELARTLTAALEGVRPHPVPGGSRRRLLRRRPRSRGLR